MFDNTTPMPGENLETKKEEGENPYYDSGFENMDEVAPFEEESTSQVEKNEKKDEDNTIVQRFDQDWSAGKTPDPEQIAESVEQNYIEGAAEADSSNANVEADVADAKRDSANKQDAEGLTTSENPLYDTSLAATIKAVRVIAEVKKIKDKVAAGDPEAIAKISEIKGYATEAVDLANKISTTGDNNPEGQLQTKQATGIAALVGIAVHKYIKQLDDAKEQYDSLSEEDKEKIKQAAENAEINGTTLEEEKRRMDEAEEKEKQEQAAQGETAGEKPEDVVLDRDMLG